MYISLLGGTITKYHRWGWGLLKQQKCVFLTALEAGGLRSGCREGFDCRRPPSCCVLTWQGRGGAGEGEKEREQALCCLSYGEGGTNPIMRRSPHDLIWSLEAPPQNAFTLVVGASLRDFGGGGCSLVHNKGWMCPKKPRREAAIKSLQGYSI